MDAGKKIVVGNWKMNPSSLAEAKQIVSPIRLALRKLKKSEVIVCPPTLFLQALAGVGLKNALSFGAQDCFYENSGAYTGEHSASMLLSAGASFVIIGHSERRALGDTNEIVNKKIHSALSARLSPIVCIGEKKRSKDGAYLSFVRTQITTALAGVSRQKCVKNIIFAYEPLWAIGKEESALPRDMHEMSIFIRKTLFELYGVKTVLKAPILYGGSISSKNAEDMMQDGDISGLLVGHHSLEPKEFIKIIRIADDMGV